MRARFAALDAAVSDAHWGRRPSVDAWSVAECLAHLNLTSAAMVPRIREALVDVRGMPGIGARAYRGGMTGRILASMMGPVPILLGVRLGKVRTPPPFVPGSELPREQTVSELRRWQEAEIALLRESAGLAIDQVTILSPFAANVRYDVYSSLRILVRHELRHIVQAERVVGQLGA